MKKNLIREWNLFVCFLMLLIISCKNIESDKNDVIAPHEITNLLAENLDGAVKLSWTDPVDEDLLGIEITYTEENNSRAAYTMPEKSILVAPKTCYAIVNNLQNNKSYTFVLKTIDLNGNSSDGIKIDFTPYAIKKCIVIFKTDNNPIYQREIIVIDNKVERPENPEIIGYIFKGWYEDEEFKKEFDFEQLISQDKYIYAKFVEDVRYTVSFITLGGTSITDLSILNGQTVNTPSVPEKEMAVFQGWYTSENCDTEYDFSLPVTNNIILYAKWNPIYTVTFDTKGGTSISSQYIESGESAISPNENPTKYKYVFMGWYTAEDFANKFDFKTEISSNITIYAKWEDVLVVEGSKGLDYKISEENVYEIIDGYYQEVTQKVCSITGIGECTDNIVYIPKSIDGYTVTKIGNKAFDNCTAITQFIISSTVTTIEDRAFQYCTGITEFTVPENITSIGDQIFYGCSSLTTIYCNSEAGNLSMWQNPSVRKVVFGDNLTGIPEFKNCSHIEEIILSKNAQSLGYRNKFEGCTNLTSINLPNSITDFGEYVFEGAGLKYIKFPSSATYLENFTRSLPYLEYVIIPVSLRYILGQTFDCTTGYKTFYLGTQSDWDYISISDEASTIKSDVYFYSETQPTSEGKWWHYDTGGTPLIWERL